MYSPLICFFKQFLSSSQLARILSICALLGFSLTTYAATQTFTATNSNDASSAANWNSAVPGQADTAQFDGTSKTFKPVNLAASAGLSVPIVYIPSGNTQNYTFNTNAASSSMYISNPSSVSYGDGIYNLSNTTATVQNSIYAATGLLVYGPSTSTPLAAGNWVFKTDTGKANFNMVSGNQTLAFAGQGSIIDIDHKGGTYGITGSPNVVVEMTQNPASGSTPAGPVGIVQFGNVANTINAFTIHSGDAQLYGTDTTIIGSNKTIQMGDSRTTTGDMLLLTYAVAGTETANVTVNAPAVSSGSGGTSTIRSLNSGTTTTSGTLTLNTPTILAATTAGSTFNLGSTSTIAGTGNVTVLGSGTVGILGTASNSGNYTVGDGTTNPNLVLNGGSGGLLPSSVITKGSTLTVNSGGTVTLGNTNQLAAGANVTLSGGTMNTGGNALSTGTLGVLTLTPGSVSTLNQGTNGTGGATFTSFSPTSSPGTLNITNWKYATNSTATAPNGTGPIVFNQQLTAAQLAAMTINGLPVYQLNSGQIVPIPEPGTVAVGVFATVIAGYKTFKNRRRKKVVSSEYLI